MTAEAVVPRRRLARRRRRELRVVLRAAAPGRQSRRDPVHAGLQRRSPRGSSTTATGSGTRRASRSTSGSPCESSSRTTRCARTSPARSCSTAPGYATRRRRVASASSSAATTCCSVRSAGRPSRRCLPRAAARAAARRGSSPAGRCRSRSPSATWPRSSTAEHDWTTLDAEPSGLADLARVDPVRDGADTVLARVVVHADRAGHVPLELGFSDRAVVHLNGTRALPRRRLLPLARLPLPRQHRLVRHGLPAAAGGAERAGARDQRELRRLGRAGPLPGRGRDCVSRPAYAPRAKMPSPPSSVSKKRLASSRCS